MLKSLVIAITFIHSVHCTSNADDSRISKYDLMTDLDAMLMQQLAPDPALSAVETWPVVKEITGIGSELIDAAEVSLLLERGVPVNEQPAFAWVRDIVEECAETLEIAPPRLVIENRGEADAYVARLHAPHVLVLTSECYELFRYKPEELRFIIGHEMGHLKCEHMKCQLVARLLTDSLRGASAGRKLSASLITPVLVGGLLSWCREAEISADRAGLLCVEGDLEVAKQAIWRLKHGTDELFDTDVVEQEMKQFEGTKFVETVRWFQNTQSRYPFVEHRCRALEKWTHQPRYHYLKQLCDRTSSPVQQSLSIIRIDIAQLPAADSFVNVAADPVVNVSFGGSRFVYKGADDVDRLSFQPDWTAKASLGNPLVLSVKDVDYFDLDDFLGACSLPIKLACGFAPIKKTVKLDSMRSTKTRPAPQATIWYRTETTVDVDSAQLAKLLESLSEAKEVVELQSGKAGVVKAHALLRQPIARFIISLNDDYPGLDVRPPTIALKSREIEKIAQEWTERLLLCEKTVRTSCESSKSQQLSFGKSATASLVLETLP